MKVTLLVDFGSTYTKVTAVDLASETLVGCSRAPSTVAADLTIGLQQAQDGLLAQIPHSLEIERTLACSSAAGGLRIVAVGLVPALTSAVAKQAALGAGGKVVQVYSHQLNPAELDEMARLEPDIVLLAGGTDGGDTQTIQHNAHALASSEVGGFFIVCGNKVVAHSAAEALSSKGKTVAITDNVLPEIGRLNAEPCQALIRDTFIKKIVHGKGLDKSQDMFEGILMPTPSAVLSAARLLADGTDRVEGLGEVVVIDIGGATTDVVSVAEGRPTRAGTVLRGLPEPVAKRTVEGDVGIRHNAPTILDLVGGQQLLAEIATCGGSRYGQAELREAISRLSTHIESVPQDDQEFNLDIALARCATRLAMDRHAGRIELVYAPSGVFHIQEGKDLTEIRRVIGTGGVLAYGREPRRILEAAAYSDQTPNLLKPKQPQFLIDNRYVLYALGLLAEVAPDTALRIAKELLVPV